MLSIENPPSDLLDIPKLITSSGGDDDDGVGVGNIKAASSDLSKSNLDDNRNNNINSLPNFSIRDYAFGARNKDITVSWPFSKKNLQLCLKHGVKELLPPFQPLDLLRNQLKRCAVYDHLLDQENLSKTDVEVTRQSDQDVPVPSNGVEHINLSRSDQTEEVPSTEEQGQGEAQGQPVVDSGADTLLESSSKRVEAAKIVPESRKTDSTIQLPVKKSRLIVKLSNLAGSSKEKEDCNMPNSFLVSETMASKVCPVCKTFSSSSNTTLNAHIDQCLSGESTVKLKVDANASKKSYKVKPRKIRLMVDIYATAKHCTLEDLDRRNGTSWAVSSTLPAQESDQLCDEERVQRESNATAEETSQEGAVYVDSDGTKVRILSKCSDTLESKGREDDGCEKLVSRDKGTKFLAVKKKTKPKKHRKFLKLASQGDSYSRKPRPNLEIRDAEEQNISMEQNGEKEVRWGQRLKAKKQANLNESAISRRWVYSSSQDDSHDDSGLNKDSRRGSDQPSLNPKNRLSSNYSTASPQRGKKMKTISYEPDMGVCWEQPNIRKGDKSPLLGSRSIDCGKKRSMILPRLKKPRKEGISMQDGCKNYPNYAATRASLSGNKALETDAAPTKMPDVSFVRSKPSFSHKKFSSKAKTFSSKGKKPLSRKRHSSPTRSALSNDLAAWPSHDDSDQQFDSMEEDYSDSQSETEGMRNNVTRNMEFSSVKFDSSSEEDTSDSEDSASEQVLARDHDHVSTEPSSSKTAVGGSFMSSNNYSDREYDDLPSPTPAQQCTKVNQGLELSNNKQELFRSEEADHVMIGEDTQTGTESYSKDGQVNYFSEVDPIPIPGPPGSFLPSPGHMDSEGLQGNSSLTTCRVQSMDNHHDLVDRDMSDSPVSAISGISNPSFTRSDSRSSERLFIAPHAVQKDTRQVFPSARVDPEIENFVPASQATHLDALRSVDRTSFPEKIAPLSLRTEQVSCCCSRKEGTSLGGSLNFQESQLLRRRTMASVPLPGKQMDSDSSRRVNNSSLSNFPMNLGHENAVNHSARLAGGDPEVKFPVRGDHRDSASPSASNPVLRLMGKNLMVVNKEEDAAMQQVRQTQLNSVNAHSNLQAYPVSGLSRGASVGNSSEDYHSFRQAVPQGGPMIFGCDRNVTALGNHFDGRLLNTFRSNVGFKTPKSPFDGPGVMLPSINAANGAFKASVEQRGDYNFGSNMLDNKHRHDLEMNAATSRPHKEIIIIDDLPENRESASVINDAMCNEGMMRNRVSSSNASRFVHPFYGNQLDGISSSMYVVRPVVNTASFQMPMNGGGNASQMNWNCNPEGSGLRRQSSLGGATSSSSPGNHVRPTFYYSPSFS